MPALADPGQPSPKHDDIPTRARFYDRDGQPISAAVFGRLREDPDYRFVARSKVTGSHGQYQVLTVWFGTDQGPFADQAGPLIFGTAAPTADGELFEDREWWAPTETEALTNHARLLQRLRRLAGRP